MGWANTMKSADYNSGPAGVSAMPSDWRRRGPMPIWLLSLILNWHEVVDDSVGDMPIAVTYCPLTASGIVYDRSLHGKQLTLGVSGQLYQGNLLFYDRQSESLWSQIQGQALTGEMT